MRQRRRRVIIQDPPKSIGGSLLGLSLFVMLLAFFMILNSMSSFEEQKTADIMRSIDDTFASKITQEGNEKPAITQSAEKNLHEGDTMERIDSLFKSQIPGYKVVKNKQRGMMQVQVTREDFEKAVKGLKNGEGGGSGFSAAFLPTLVSLMRTDMRGTPYRMEITYFTDENPARVQNQKPQRMAGLIRDIAAVAGDIEKAGLQAKLMTIGLQKGDPDMVDLVFQRHVPFDPAGAKNLKSYEESAEDEQKITPQ